MRSWCGVCVESQAVSRPSAPTSAAAERASSGHGAMRWLTSVSETTTSQPSNSCSVVVGRARAAGDVRPDLREEQHLVLRAPRPGRRRPAAGRSRPTTSSAASAPVARSSARRRPRRCRRRSGRRPWRRAGASSAARAPGIGGGPRRAASMSARREDLHVRQRLRGGRVDSDDAGVREQRADERDRERALERQVLDVRRLAAEEARILLSEHAVPEDAHSAEPIVARSGIQQPCQTI